MYEPILAIVLLIMTLLFQLIGIDIMELIQILPQMTP